MIALYNKIRISCIGFLVFSNVLLSQEQLSGHFYKSDFQISERLTISKHSIAKQLYKNYNVETPFWETDVTLPILNYSKRDSLHFFICEHPKKGSNTVIITKASNGLLRVHPLRNAKKDLENYKFSELPLQLYFTEEFHSNLKQLKSMDDITKSDLITAINFTHNYEKLIVDFGKTENLQNFYLFRISENLYHYKLYDLGYNPFDIPETGNYLDKYKDDPDLKILFTPENIFKLRLN